MKITKENLKNIIIEELVDLMELQPGEEERAGMKGSLGIAAAKKIMAVDAVMKALGVLKEKDDPMQKAHFLNFISQQIDFDIMSNLQAFKAAGKKQAGAREKMAPEPEAAPEQEQP